MSVNRELPHVLVLPEDDANHQLATGFRLELDPSLTRRIQVLPVASGWTHVLDSFHSNQVNDMDRYPHRFMVLLIDLDDDLERLKDAKAKVPDRLTTRVFILSTLSEPEALKKDLGSYEDIGSKMARDCREGTNEAWGHALLRHNASEIDRLREHVRPILFPSI